MPTNTYLRAEEGNPIRINRQALSLRGNMGTILDQFGVRLRIWRLFCYHGADEDSSEPYLWVIGFKFDGSTMRQQLTRLVWTPDLFFSAGSHGNIGDGWRPGSKRSIPLGVGTWETTLKELTLTDAQANATTVPGALGFVAVLLEENNVTGLAAEAGHQALNLFVAGALEEFVTGLDLLEVNAAVAQRMVDGASREQAMTAELQNRFTGLQQRIADGASDVVEDAMRANMNIPESGWAYLDPDEVMGRAFQLVTADQLLAEGDFTLDFTDEMADPGRYKYNLHSSVRALVRRKTVPSTLPAAHDIEIQGIVKGFSRDRRQYYIATVGGVVGGNPWWLERSDAASMIANGERAFYVRTADGQRNPVTVVSPPGRYWSYLTTPPDPRGDNNLLALPKLVELPGFNVVAFEPDPHA